MFCTYITAVATIVLILNVGPSYGIYNIPQRHFGGRGGRILPPYGGGYDLWPQYGYNFSPHFNGEYHLCPPYAYNGFSPFFDDGFQARPLRGHQSDVARWLARPVLSAQHLPAPAATPDFGGAQASGRILSGSCPRVRNACPATRTSNLSPEPMTCKADNGCSPGQKCCFDICLQRDVCKNAEP